MCRVRKLGIRENLPRLQSRRKNDAGGIYVLMDARIDNESRMRYLRQLFESMATIGGCSAQVPQTDGI